MRLDAILRAMGSSLGDDLSSVHIEVDDAFCRRHGAEAVTRGEAISFAAGMLDLDSEAGRVRLAHELIHVVQNRRGRASDDAEAEAERLAPLVAGGEAVVVCAKPTAAVLCVLTDGQKRVLMTPHLAGAKGTLNEYVNTIGSVGALFTFFQQVGAAVFATLGLHYYPDQMKSIKNNWTNQEITQLAGLSALTLTALEAVSLDWQKSMLRVLRDTLPNATALTPPPNGAVLVPGATAGVPARVDQTAQHMNLVNTVVTERNNAARATRNLIFNALGVCVAEVNFDNHGFNAVSGHLHVYPVWAMPITGHHISGTPEFQMADYPVLWRTLPGGVTPQRALGT